MPQPEPEKKLSKEKEVIAMMMNHKEQRLLEKSERLLTIEKKYAIKLIDLDKTGIKLHQKMLRSRVSKIRSYLPPEDILRYKTQEERGVFRSGRISIDVGHMWKVHAAERRLKILPNRELLLLTRADLAEPLYTDVTESKPIYRTASPEDSANNRQGSGKPLFRTTRAKSAKLQGSKSAEDLATFGQEVDSNHVRPKSSFVARQSEKADPEHSFSDLKDSTDIGSGQQTTGHNRNSSGSLTQRSRGAGQLQPQTSKKRTNNPRKQTITGRDPVVRVPGDHIVRVPGDNIVRVPGVEVVGLPVSDEDGDSLSDSDTDGQTDPTNRKPTRRPVTTGEIARKKSTASKAPPTRRPKTATGVAPSRNRPATGVTPLSLNYSSHKAVLNPEYDRKLRRSADTRRASIWSSSSIGSELERENRHEKLSELLRHEGVHAEILDTRRRNFITSLDRWIEEHPAVASKEEKRRSSLSVLRREQDAEAATKSPIVTHISVVKSDLENEQALWKDLTKCRYLRMPEEMVNLDGVRTLAIEQFQILNQFKKQFTPSKPVVKATRKKATIAQTVEVG